MSSKTIPFKQPLPLPKPAEAWVEGTTATQPKLDGPTKRLTVDISEEMHTRLKFHCVRRKTLIAD